MWNLLCSLRWFVAALVISAVSGALRVSYPANGTIVATGRVDVGLFISQDMLQTVDVDTVKSCVRLDGTEMNCKSSDEDATVVIVKKPGHHTVEVDLKYVDGTEWKSAGSAVSEFTAIDTSSCRFGEEPCMSHKPWCADRSTFRFYVYPDLPANSAPEYALRRSDAMSALLDVLRRSPFVTAKPAEACVLIPSLDTLCQANTCQVPEVAVSALLYSHSLWNNGKDHVIFNFMDSATFINIGQAVMVKSSFGPSMDVVALARYVNNSNARDNEHYRSGYDVTFPLAFYRCGFHPQAHLMKFDDKEIPASYRRDVLVSFKGARHDLPQDHPAYTRNLLSAIHNGQDVIIATYCAFESLECANFTKKVLTTGPGTFVQECQPDTAYSNTIHYDKLMLRSQFTLIVPGEGLHSYRLLEAMSAGSIPVIVGGSSLPFLEFLPWDKMVVFQSDTSLGGILSIPSKLRAIPLTERWKMQQRCLEVFRSYMRDLTSQAHALVDVFVSRYRDAYINNKKASFVPKFIADRREPFKCVPAFGTSYHCPQSVADYVDMNVDGVATMDLGDEQDFVATGLESALSAHSSGNKQGALLMWRRWANAILGDVRPPRTSFIRSHALSLGLSFVNAASVIHDSKRYALAMKRSQSAIMWAGLEVTRNGFGLFNHWNISWNSFVDQQMHTATAVHYSWYGIEPPLLLAPARPADAAAASAMPPILPKGSRIGIVRLCDYDPMVSPFTPIASRNSMKYARKYGYKLYMEGKALDPTRPIAWSKIIALDKYLSLHEWLLWLDCDSLIMNSEVALETLLWSALSAAEDPDNVHLIISEDGAMINTGVMFIRNHEWSKQFLRLVYGEPGNVFEDHSWWEQAAMHHFLNDDFVRTERPEIPKVPQESATAAATWQLTRSHVQFVPQWWINSYPPALADMLPFAFGPRQNVSTLHAKYQSGHFIISFSGCNVLLGNRSYCNEMFETYAAAAK